MKQLVPGDLDQSDGKFNRVFRQGLSGVLADVVGDRGDPRHQMRLGDLVHLEPTELELAVLVTDCPFQLAEVSPVGICVLVQ
ncbi:MAG: hypothetical protein IT363_09925 [Methanoregulaceae archaeon]|nr:hypothetical protein [Methanoregulaceae archaeon]